MTALSAATRQVLGRTGLSVPAVCVGTSPLGEVEDGHGHGIPFDQAVAAVRAALAGPLDFVDTSNGYGDSERRVGTALRAAGGLPTGAVLATKVDPAPGSSDFSGARVRASVAESLERLGVDHLSLLHLHDPERITFEAAMAPDGPVQALVELQREGVVDFLGVAGGTLDLMRRFVDTGLFDVLLNHNRFTLVDSSAAALFTDATAAGVGVLNGAPYGGGMLVRGPDVQPQYCYRPVGDATLARVRRMEQACAREGVPLAAAALQYSLRDPRITSTVVGMSDPARIAQTLELASTPISDGLWAELDTLAAIRDTDLG